MDVAHNLQLYRAILLHLYFDLCIYIMQASYTQLDGVFFFIETFTDCDVLSRILTSQSVYFLHHSNTIMFTQSEALRPLLKARSEVRLVLLPVNLFVLHMAISVPSLLLGFNNFVNHPLHGKLLFF
jgi:hypothetical protein